MSFPNCRLRGQHPAPWRPRDLPPGASAGRAASSPEGQRVHWSWTSCPGPAGSGGQKAGRVLVQKNLPLFEREGSPHLPGTLLCTRRLGNPVTCLGWRIMTTMLTFYRRKLEVMRLWSGKQAAWVKGTHLNHEATAPTSPLSGAWTSQWSGS